MGRGGEKKEIKKKRNKEKTEKMRSSHPRKTRAQDDGLMNSFDDIFRI